MELNPVIIGIAGRNWLSGKALWQKILKKNLNIT